MYTMKAKIILVSFFLSLTFLSCKKESKSDNSVAVTEVKANTFDVTIDAVIKNDDELILFYKDESINYFDEKNTVYIGVKGNNLAQKVTFNIPEGVMPNDIRLDISSKINQEPIKINSVTLSFEGKQSIISQVDFLKFFKPNEYIQYNDASATATFSEKDGNYDPFFNTKPPIYLELERLLGKPL